MSIYKKSFRIKVAKEAAQPSNDGQEQVIAMKYGIKPWTVLHWRDLYLAEGTDGLTKGKLRGPRKSDRELQLEKEIAALREEIEVLKKAAAFLASVKAD